MGKRTPEWELGLGGVGLKCPTKMRRPGKNGGTWVCRCGKCAKCGHSLHTALHMHAHGFKPGDAPFDHRFEPKVAKEKAR